MVIAALGYVPNEAARRLQSARFTEAPVSATDAGAEWLSPMPAGDELGYPEACHVLASLHLLARAWGASRLDTDARERVSMSLAAVRGQLVAHDLEGPGALLNAQGELARASRNAMLIGLEEHLRPRVQSLLPREPDAYDWGTLLSSVEQLATALNTPSSP
jgi:hypothetical protein